MALHKSTAKASSKLALLRASQASLELRAKQLAARKSEVESKADRLARSLKRTIDTREKIVLGALVKMVQLDRFTLCGRNDNDILPNRHSNEAVTVKISDRYDNAMTPSVMSASYDLDFLVGALLTLSEQLDNDTATFVDLRKRGAAFRLQAKIDRVVKLRLS